VVPDTTDAPPTEETSTGGLTDLTADSLRGESSRIGDGELGEWMCVYQGDSCHDRDLCPADTDGDGEPDNDGFCFEPPGPASTPKTCKNAKKKTCKNAKKNGCTIDSCD
jgi:hypothetical protein